MTSLLQEWENSSALPVHPPRVAQDILDEIGWENSKFWQIPRASKRAGGTRIQDIRTEAVFCRDTSGSGASPLLSALVEFIKDGLKCCEVRPEVYVQQRNPQYSRKNAKGPRTNVPAGFKIAAKGNPYASLFWCQHGWKKTGSNLYQGKFKSDLGEFKGKAEQFPSGRLDFFILNPPQKLLRKHPHAPCFQENGDGWYFIHNNNEGYFDLSSAIMQVEQILQETSRL